MIPLPYALVALVAVFILGCATGYSNRDSAAKISAAKAYQAAKDHQEELQGKIDVISAQYEATREAANRKSVERTNTVREFYSKGAPVDANCALPSTMYGLLANSVRDANAAASSELSPDMPHPATTTQPSH